MQIGELNINQEPELGGVSISMTMPATHLNDEQVKELIIVLKGALRRRNQKTPRKHPRAPA